MSFILVIFFLKNTANETEKINLYFILPSVSTYFYSPLLYLLYPLPLLSVSSSSYYISFVLILLLLYYLATLFPRDKIPLIFV